ncbi:hypothetical protein B484DRAFT_405461, partial [Ochromonadaceae sp. CCMP2298]
MLLALALCLSVLGVLADLDPFPSKGTALTASQAEEAFTKWFLDNGGFMQGVTLADFGHMGRGFAATKALQDSEKVLQIPHHLIFSTRNMPRHLEPAVVRILEKLEDQDVALCTWLLIEKIKPHSFFQPYLDVLPAYVPSLLHYSEPELAELQNAELEAEARDMQRHTRLDYATFLTAFRQIQDLARDDDDSADLADLFDSITLGQFEWAASM